MRESDFTTRLEDLSGWLLPEGRWHPVEEWWHLSALYELRENGYDGLQDAATHEVLKGGDEARIRDHVAELGLIRMSRGQIDGVKISNAQLRTLQQLLKFCDASLELGIIHGLTGVIKYMGVERILKLRNPELFFPKAEEAYRDPWNPAP